MKKTLAIFAFCGSVLITGAARAEVITFDSDASGYNYALLTEGGLTFDTVSPGTCLCGYAVRPGHTPYVQSTGDTSKIFIFNGGDTGMLDLTGPSGYSISVTSIEFGRGEYDTLGGIVTVSGGGTTETFSLSSTAAFTTEDLSAFGYVSNLNITYSGSVGGYLAMDNIQYTVQSAVPEPSTLGLFVSGLFGICMIRRRSTPGPSYPVCARIFRQSRSVVTTTYPSRERN